MSDRRQSTLRRGIATIWVILSLPVSLVLLITVVEIGNLWTARTELQTALESAALAGVKTWADQSESQGPPHNTPGLLSVTQAGRDAAVATFGVNSINGVALSSIDPLDPNETDDGNSANGYDNTDCDGEVVLSGVTAGTNDLVASAQVGCGGVDVDFGVLVRKTVAVTSLTESMFGLSVGPFDVSGQAVAVARCTGAPATTIGNPIAIRVESVTCP